MKTIGLVMIVKNEERCLGKCLARAGKLADEIYITDTGSTDGTIEIAKKFRAHISHFTWNNDFAAARNFALSQSQCDWNLVLDADEYLLKGSKKDLEKFIEKGDRLGAILNHNLYREPNGEVSCGYTYIPRLIPKGTCYEGTIHEQIASQLPVVPLPLVFEHDGYLQEGKGERNIQILQAQLDLTPKDPYLLYQTANTLRLMGEFERAYPYFREFYAIVPDTGTGYRVQGVLAMLYDLLELHKYDEGLKVIEQEKNALDTYADYHFACGTFYMKAILSDVQRYISYLPRIRESYERCLEIGEVPEHEGVFGNGSFKAAYNLGVWFEVNGDKDNARRYYKMAERSGYQPALDRLKAL